MIRDDSSEIKREGKADGNLNTLGKVVEFVEALPRTILREENSLLKACLHFDCTIDSSPGGGRGREEFERRERKKSPE